MNSVNTFQSQENDICVAHSCWQAVIRKDEIKLSTVHKIYLHLIVRFPFFILILAVASYVDPHRHTLMENIALISFWAHIWTVNTYACLSHCLTWKNMHNRQCVLYLNAIFNFGGFTATICLCLSSLHLLMYFFFPSFFRHQPLQPPRFGHKPQHQQWSSCNTSHYIFI